MLRRRILASAMASVMALGSVAVVANAEETATAVKTKADLEAYIASLEGFRTNEINDYGSVSGEKFLDAVEYADNVLADPESSVDDYTVAYAMVEATYKALKIYSADELKLLIDNNKANYESGNVYNEELGDPIFNEDDFGKFEDAYEEAEAVLDSADSRIITDAYEALEAAANMGRYTVITKAQFRTALKAYEAVLQKEYAYDSWRIGTMDSGWIDLRSTNNETGYWGYQGQEVAYGVLYNQIASANAFINEAYETMDEIKTLNKTSLPSIVQGCFAAENAVKVYDAWSADDTNRASKSSVKKLLNQYHGQLVYDYATTTADKLYDAVIAVTGGDLEVNVRINDGQATKWVAAADVDAEGDYGYWNLQQVIYDVNPDKDGDPTKVNKLVGAEMAIKSGVQFYIPLDDNGFWNGEALTTSKPTDGKYKVITKNVATDLSDYVLVTSESLFDAVVAGAPGSEVFNSDINNVLDGDGYYFKDQGSWVEQGNTERFGKWGQVQGTGGTVYQTGYVSADGKYMPYATDLYSAMILAETYIEDADDVVDNRLYDLSVSHTLVNPYIDWSTGSPVFTVDEDTYEIDNILDLDTTDSLADSTKGSTSEWTIVYRYLKYALEDKYSGSRDLYTKADVSALIDKAYELAELTGDAALFSVNHNDLVEARQDALDWLKGANKDKKYKDNVTAIEGVTATNAYLALKAHYDALEKDYNAFKYSFEQIYLAIADAKTMIDDGDLENTASLQAALNEVSYRLSIVESFEEAYGIENDAFTSDRFFQGYNRVYTGYGDGYDLVTGVKLNDEGKLVEVTTHIDKADDNAVSASHKHLAVAYEALLAEIKAQSEVTVLKGDVDGNGTVNAMDAAALLKNVVAGVTMDAAVADYNADGTINALDAAAILTAIVNG